MGLTSRRSASSSSVPEKTPSASAAVLGRRVWLSADILYRRGGETVTDGVGDDNGMHGWSAGGTAAFPVARASIVLTYEHVVERDDDGPDGWFFRTALILPL